MYIYIYMHTYMHTYLHTCMYRYAHTHVCVSMHIGLCMYVYIYTHTRIHAYIHARTHQCKIGSWLLSSYGFTHSSRAHGYMAFQLSSSTTQSLQQQDPSQPAGAHDAEGCAAWLCEGDALIRAVPVHFF